MGAEEAVLEYNDPEDIALNEAEKILESYTQGESYSNKLSSENDPEEMQDNIIEAVDQLEIETGYDLHSKIMRSSGAITSSVGAAILLTGNPIGAAPLLLGGGQYFAARYRNNPEIQEMETKAFLQDAMKRNLEVEEQNGEYQITFENEESLY